VSADVNYAGDRDMASNKKPCIYCDVLTAKGKRGVHIIQEAIGGVILS
jgi:hypothetical protein